MQGGDGLDPDNTSAVRSHRSAVQVAEGVRQAAVAAAANNQASVTAASVAYYRTAKASALANGLASLAGFYQQSLRALGTGGV